MDPPHYTTTDRYLSSFILYHRAALISCTRLGPKKVEYRFRSDRRLHELLRLYWSGLPTPVVPRRLFAALQRLKSLSLR